VPPPSSGRAPPPLWAPAHRRADGHRHPCRQSPHRPADGHRHRCGHPPHRRTDEHRCGQASRRAGRVGTATSAGCLRIQGSQQHPDQGRSAPHQRPRPGEGRHPTGPARSTAAPEPRRAPLQARQDTQTRVRGCPAHTGQDTPSRDVRRLRTPGGPSGPAVRRDDAASVARYGPSWSGAAAAGADRRAHPRPAAHPAWAPCANR
ncbi:MAG: hypothetical protein QOC85_3536, partial [Streptomyces sp.]|nr:hypothetical protein [Streptomyces sp.]